jgi:hypothetical protein
MERFVWQQTGRVNPDEIEEGEINSSYEKRDTGSKFGEGNDRSWAAGEEKVSGHGSGSNWEKGQHTEGQPSSGSSWGKKELNKSSSAAGDSSTGREAQADDADLMSKLNNKASGAGQTERASRPLVGFGALIDNTIKGLTCLHEIMSRYLIK